MEKIVTALGFALTTLVILFALRLIGPLMGALAGWIVGLFFGSAIMSVLAGLGVDTSLFSMWQLGAALAFIGTFFTLSITREK